MKYKIVVDSCCELPQDLKNDIRFEIVPLTLIVGDNYEKEDNMEFDQREFLDAVAACPECPKSACPSPERYRKAYETEAQRVYVVTLSSKLSGSYNSAVLGKIYIMKNMGKRISTLWIPGQRLVVRHRLPTRLWNWRKRTCICRDYRAD